ncbi:MULTISPECIES: AAA family ATPase [Vibrio]|uniref:AAA family ATPase n=1 Tax=Vibrio TaxID=662 RepID=UPI00063658D4|nr:MULTISPECIES: ATP-binding protein [Vibrio]TCN98728.1 ATPase family protein associated with various cellular activities (AAA) [Vibrio crassostreae]TCT78491.1 ATPase family protein associated with various cellular activities (AAA) [Vibrio crassostreae]CAK2780847.1 AAA ATPase central domain protein [Vibrio crassostreae]CDT82178.1 AAA ATPase central domain protein [Vibrio coralliirubri]
MKTEDFVNFARLALTGSDSDVRLYLGKLIRKMRKSDIETAAKLEGLLKTEPKRQSPIMRKGSTVFPNNTPTTSDDIPLIKKFIDNKADTPVLSEDIKKSLEQVILERKNATLLASNGLSPSSSVIFQGPPGVGKTMTAKWLADQLDVPFYILDLTAVMSSLLGKTGNNLRNVIDFAKSHPCVLLLDEIDAIAKKRSDEADVGELKRLVTVMLQELEDWPGNGLLIAATNHPELVDPALWRRFDLEVTFELPSNELIEVAIQNFLSHDYKHFEPWICFMINKFSQSSFSDIKRTISKLRKQRILEPKFFEESLTQQLLPDIESMSQKDRIDTAVRLVSHFSISQQKASKLTKVSRDTIRKRLKD